MEAGNFKKLSLRSGYVDLSAAANYRKVARKQLRVTSGERPAHGQDGAVDRR